VSEDRTPDTRRLTRPCRLATALRWLFPSACRWGAVDVSLQEVEREQDEELRADDVIPRAPLHYGRIFCQWPDLVEKVCPPPNAKHGELPSEGTATNAPGNPQLTREKPFHYPPFHRAGKTLTTAPWWERRGSY
jgi:hypothetical protein